MEMPETEAKEEENKEKTQTDNKHSNVSNATNGYGYDIELYDVWDTTSKRLPVFGANRIIEDKNVYLYNYHKALSANFSNPGIYVIHQKPIFCHHLSNA